MSVLYCSEPEPEPEPEGVAAVDLAETNQGYNGVPEIGGCGTATILPAMAST